MNNQENTQILNRGIINREIQYMEQTRSRLKVWTIMVTIITAIACVYLGVVAPYNLRALHQEQKQKDHRFLLRYRKLILDHAETVQEVSRLQENIQEANEMYLNFNDKIRLLEDKNQQVVRENLQLKSVVMYLYQKLSDRWLELAIKKANLSPFKTDQKIKQLLGKKKGETEVQWSEREEKETVMANESNGWTPLSALFDQFRAQKTQKFYRYGRKNSEERHNTLPTKNNTTHLEL